jgi:hypothetical protein
MSCAISAKAHAVLKHRCSNGTNVLLFLYTGDWFNRLDFSYETNNFGVGLPPAAKNEAAWPIKQPLLANHSLKPSSDLIKVGLKSHKPP